ncbi:MAG: hypothetical protein K5643_04350 [Saccharofermentans sp.]|nr:hypothetical protein [Saccharofermentans sp.]
MLLWLAFVIIAVILAVANLILSVIGRPRLRNWLTIGSLSFTALEAWAQYNITLNYVINFNYEAIYLTVPLMNTMLIIFIIIMILLNILANVLYKSRSGKIGMAFEGREFRSRSTDAIVDKKAEQAKEKEAKA